MLSAETELLGHCVCLDWSQRPGSQGPGEPLLLAAQVAQVPRKVENEG